jgi:hypothetical protein
LLTREMGGNLTVIMPGSFLGVNSCADGVAVAVDRFHWRCRQDYPSMRDSRAVEAIRSTMDSGEQPGGHYREPLIWLADGKS